VSEQTASFLLISFLVLDISIGSAQSARRQSVVRLCQQVMSIKHEFNADAVDGRLL